MSSVLRSFAFVQIVRLSLSLISVVRHSALSASQFRQNMATAAAAASDTPSKPKVTKAAPQPKGKRKIVEKKDTKSEKKPKSAAPSAPASPASPVYKPTSPVHKPTDDEQPKNQKKEKQSQPQVSYPAQTAAEDAKNKLRAVVLKEFLEFCNKDEHDGEWPYITLTEDDAASDAIESAFVKFTNGWFKTDQICERNDCNKNLECEDCNGCSKHCHCKG